MVFIMLVFFNYINNIGTNIKNSELFLYIMKNISIYIIEKLKINHDVNNYTCCPETKDELADIIIDRVKQNGIRHMFNGNLNDIDVSKITDMSGLMNQANNKSEINIKRRIGNIDISGWDVHNLKTAQSMFMGCPFFNCDLSNWDIRNLENASAMFAGCNELDFDISKWNPEKLKETDKTYKMIANTKLEKQSWMR